MGEINSQNPPPQPLGAWNFPTANSSSGSSYSRGKWDSGAEGRGEWEASFLPEAFTPLQLKAQKREACSLQVKNSAFESGMPVGEQQYHH